MKRLTLFLINGRGQLCLFYELLLKDSSSKNLEAWRINIKRRVMKQTGEMACLKAQTQSIKTKSLTQS